MLDGEQKSWRDVLEKHHAALLDEMNGCFDAAVQHAAQRSAEQVREEARLALSEHHALSEQRYEKALEDARQMGDAAVAQQRDALEKHRQEEIERLRVEAQQSIAEVKKSYLAAADVEREKAQRSFLQSYGERWNQATRRFRKVDSEPEIFALIAEFASSHARRAVVLKLESNLATNVFAESGSPGLTFPVAKSPALSTVVETKDPIVAAASESELGTELNRLLQPAAGERAYLFPVNKRHQVTGIIAASGNVDAMALELLGEMGGLRLESLEPIPAAESRQPNNRAERSADSLVQIAAPSANKRELVAENNKSWNDLEPGDQKVHLQAQRFARVQVAEMRLYKPEAVRSGTSSQRLYSALRPEIDTARKEFLTRFLPLSPTMVDYLHLEILRSLAHNDDRLLGGEYPGPMV